ncbi:hypothetical protein ACWCPQ_14435 [Nocardia sp. NPDC001965]
MTNAYLRDTRESSWFCSIGELGSPLKEGTMGFRLIMDAQKEETLGLLYATLHQGFNRAGFYRIDSFEIRKCECGDKFMKVTWKEMV